MAAFHEIQFPPEISYGASGGPGYLTTIVATASGHEHRNSNWAAARGKWDVATGLRDRTHVAELIAFFRARRGRAHGFRFKDWTDYQGVAQVLGTGDGSRTTFQLIKNYSSGGVIEARTITKPVYATVQIYKDGVVVSSGVATGPGVGCLVARLLLLRPGGPAQAGVVAGDGAPDHVAAGEGAEEDREDRSGADGSVEQPPEPGEEEGRQDQLDPEHQTVTLLGLQVVCGVGVHERSWRGVGGTGGAHPPFRGSL